MWTMGYNDSGEFNLPDSCNGSRKLRPFASRQMASPAGNNSSTSASPCLGLLHHGTDFFALNHHLAMGDKRDFNTQPVVMSSTRWNPTPEQLRTLEELYRRGTRTPTADQIQHITAQLRRYGKIEGKNVFYWFQNHKARERQKRRRQRDTATTENINEQQQNRDNNTDIFERKDTGASRTGYEGEQTKNWARSANCSTLSEEAAAILLQQRASKAAGVPECRAEGWMQLDEGELQHRRGFMERNATLQMMQLSCLTTTSSSATATRTSTAMAATPRPRPPPPSAAAKIRAMDQKVIMAGQDLNIFIAPYHKDNGGQGVLINHFSNNSSAINEGHGRGDSPTLQLFPLRSGGYGSNNDGINEKETEISVAAAAMNANNLTPPFQFFEFLPLKNQ